MLNIPNNSMRSDYFFALSITSDRFHLDLPVFIQKQLKCALRIDLFKKNWTSRASPTSRLSPAFEFEFEIVPTQLFDKF